jgi:histidine triad (HIT) family protein
VSCLFCRIRDGEIPATKVHDDEHCFAIRDLAPQAPHHILVIPKDHIATLNDLDDGDVVGKMFLAAKKIAADLGVAEDGWRALFNVNKGAGQSVFHIHLHLLAGRPLGWPPG